MSYLLENLCTQANSGSQAIFSASVLVNLDGLGTRLTLCKLYAIFHNAYYFTWSVNVDLTCPIPLVEQPSEPDCD